MVLGRLEAAGEVPGLLGVAVVYLDADPPVGAHAGSVDVEHVGVGLSDRLLHQVTVADVDLLF